MTPLALVQIQFFLFLALALCQASSPRLLQTNPGFHRMQLYGNDTIAYYYVNLYVGTPPQIQTVIVSHPFDTKNTKYQGKLPLQVGPL